MHQIAGMRLAGDITGWGTVRAGTAEVPGSSPSRVTPSNATQARSFIAETEREIGDHFVSFVRRMELTVALNVQLSRLDTVAAEEGEPAAVADLRSDIRKLVAQLTAPRA